MLQRIFSIITIPIIAKKQVNKKSVHPVRVFISYPPIIYFFFHIHHPNIVAIGYDIKNMIIELSINQTKCRKYLCLVLIPKIPI